MSADSIMLLHFGVVERRVDWVTWQYCNAHFRRGRLSALTYETLRMPGCIDVPVLSHECTHMWLYTSHLYPGMYKAALMRR